MKRFAIVLVALTAVAAQAQQGAPADVPPSHWAYKAVDALFRAGLLKGYPDGTFRGSRPVSRYELAGTLSQVNSQLQPRIDDLKARLERLRDRTAPQSQDAGPLEQEIQTLRQEVSSLRALTPEVDDLRTRFSTFREQMERIRRDLREMRDHLGRIRA